MFNLVNPPEDWWFRPQKKATASELQGAFEAEASHTDQSDAYHMWRLTAAFGMARAK